MRYQVISGAALTSSQLLDGISYSTGLPNEYLTVSSSKAHPHWWIAKSCAAQIHPLKVAAVLSLTCQRKGM